MEPLVSLLVLVLLAYSLGEVARFFNIPRVVGQISAGMILGVPFIKEKLFIGTNAELISFLSDLGILLLFFFVGLQIDMYSFKKYAGEAALISIFNTAIPFIMGFLFCKFLGLSIIASLIVGICLAVASQSVSISVLEELNMLKSKISKLIVTAGAVDDIFELIIISIILALVHASLGQASTQMVIADIALFVVAIVAFRYLIIPVLMHLFAKEKSITYLFTGAIVITLILAIITFYLGLGSIIGALFAGIIVREILLEGKNKNPWEEHNISKAIHIVSFGFLVPVFFAWVGINTNLILIISSWKFVLALVLISLAGTIIGAMIGVLLHKGGTLKEGFIVGWGVAPKGDVELVIAAIALNKMIITQEVYSALIMMAILTTLISAIVFRKLVKNYKKIYA